MESHAGGDPRLSGTEETHKVNVFDRFGGNELNPESKQTALLAESGKE